MAYSWYDCLNRCFIPSPKYSAPLPANNYSVFGNSPRGHQLEPGSLRQNYYEWQGMEVSLPNSIRWCTNCHTTDAPMRHREAEGPKTLCNACGIRDRKERERRELKNASTSEEEATA